MKKKTITFTLTLTVPQYDLLCECIRYRAADNHSERFKAETANRSTAFFDKVEEELDELKTMIYDRDK